MSIPHLFITLLIAVLMYLYSVKEKFNLHGGNKQFLKEGATVNKDLQNKLKNRIKLDCKKIKDTKVRSNIILNDRLECRYLSNCKNMADENFVSWTKPKIMIDNNIIKGV
jgi:hypothetical protein